VVAEARRFRAFGLDFRVFWNGATGSSWAGVRMYRSFFAAMVGRALVERKNFVNGLVAAPPAFRGAGGGG